MTSLVREAADTGAVSGGDSLGQPTLKRQTSIEMMIVPEINNIVYRASCEFDSADADGKSAIIGLVAEIAKICKGEDEVYQFVGNIPYLIPQLCAGITSETKDSTVLASESLSCLRALSTRFDASYFKSEEAEDESQQPYYQLLAALGQCISDGGPIVPEALSTLEVFAQYIVWDATYENALWLCDVVLQQLTQMDVEEALKLTSIRCISVLLATYGDMLAERLDQILPVFVARMGNLSTANACAKGLALVAASESSLDLSQFVTDRKLLDTLCSYLRKSTPQLPSDGAMCIAALVKREGQKNEQSLRHELRGRSRRTH